MLLVAMGQKCVYMYIHYTAVPGCCMVIHTNYMAPVHRDAKSVQLRELSGSSCGHVNAPLSHQILLTTASAAANSGHRLAGSY